MPSIAAFHHVSLTVTDLARSVEWYTRVLGFAVDAKITGETFRRTRLRHPDSGLVLTLTRHDNGAFDPFDETRVGVDHLAFRVPTFADVEEWARRFDEHGVEHSSIKRGSGDMAMITLRDPDNIQLEVTAVQD